MISQSHIEIYTKLLALQSFDGLEVSSSKNTVVYSLDEIEWTFELSPYGTIISRLFENGKKIGSNSCFGLYPQFKNKDQIKKSFRQHVGRTIGIDWRNDY